MSDKTEIRCTLICIVNKIDVYSEFENNLRTQEGINYSIIPCMNLNNEYSGARKAFNESLKMAEGDYVVFLHPDIRFLNKYSLKKIIDFCDIIGDFGVVGIAGCPEKLIKRKRIIFSSIIHGLNKTNAGILIQKPRKVQTVDECLFIMKRNLVDKIRFCETSGWHLYAVEQCLRTRALGYDNYVVPAEIWHMSDGKSLDPNYVKQIKALIARYKKKYVRINTTVRKWETRGFFSALFLYYYYYKQCIKVNLNHFIKNKNN